MKFLQEPHLFPGRVGVGRAGAGHQPGAGNQRALHAYPTDGRTTNVNRKTTNFHEKTLSSAALFEKKVSFFLKKTLEYLPRAQRQNMQPINEITGVNLHNLWLERERKLNKTLHAYAYVALLP